MFIEFIKGTNQELGPVITKFAAEAKQGKIKLVTSTLALAEVVRPYKCNDQSLPPTDRRLVAESFRDKGILLVDVIQPIAVRAREIQWDIPGIKPCDAIHLATAEYAKVDYFDTIDERTLAEKVRKATNFAWVHPFTIGVPKENQTDLFYGITKSQEDQSI